MNDIHATVFQNGTATFMARILDFNGGLVTSSNVTSASYSIYLLDESKPESRIAVTGHQNVNLNPADILSSSLQKNVHWIIDDKGFNFCWTLNVTQASAFTMAGRHYLVEIKLLAGNVPFIIRYRLFVL